VIKSESPAVFGVSGQKPPNSVEPPTPFKKPKTKKADLHPLVSVCCAACYQATRLNMKALLARSFSRLQSICGSTREYPDSLSGCSQGITQ